jgi:hypothetical protein
MSGPALQVPASVIAFQFTRHKEQNPPNSWGNVHKWYALFLPCHPKKPKLKRCPTASEGGRPDH